MNADIKFPVSNLELAELLGSRTEIRFPASLDEFWALLEVAEYNVEYFDHEIIATMSYEADLHSDVATQISYLLKNIHGGKPEFRVRNGNRPICIPECDFTVFNPDGSVIAMTGKQYEYRPGMNADLTPVLVFEVLSKSTRSHDLADKLPCYKTIPSLLQIIYVDTQRISITVWERQEESGKWLETTLQSLDDVFLIDGTTVSVREIYKDSLA